MTRRLEHELMRLLHGELSIAAAAALRERMEREPELAAAYERLERAWAALDLPPSPGVPPGFAGRVMARIAASRELARPGTLSWRAAPGWVRAAAAACLIAGAALGVGVGERWTSRAPGAAAEGALAQVFGSVQEEGSDSLNESYWGEVADTTLEGQEQQDIGDATASDDGGAKDAPL